MPDHLRYISVLYVYAIASGDGHPVGMAVAYFITDTVIANLVRTEQSLNPKPPSDFIDFTYVTPRGYYRIPRGLTTADPLTASPQKKRPGVSGGGSRTAASVCFFALVPVWESLRRLSDTRARCLPGRMKLLSVSYGAPLASAPA